MVSVPAINKSRLSAESSSMVGLVLPFSASELSAVSKIVGNRSDDVEVRASNSRIRFRETFYSQCHLMERKLWAVSYSPSTIT